MSNRYHFISTKLNGKVLDVNGGNVNPGTRVIVWDRKCPPSSNQLWRFEDIGGGKFFIVSAMNPNMVLDVEGGSPRPGSSIIIWNKKYPPSANQLFQWNDGMLQSCLNPNMMLDVEGCETNVVLWNKHGNPNQKWNVDQAHY